jgi:hypothetical protein
VCNSTQYTTAADSEARPQHTVQVQAHDPASVIPRRIPPLFQPLLSINGTKADQCYRSKAATMLQHTKPNSIPASAQNHCCCCYRRLHRLSSTHSVLLPPAATRNPADLSVRHTQKPLCKLHWEPSYGCGRFDAA